ncbi:hypothetical protein DQ384_10115 [Sphaerisporangium album]|uniref:Uncharacterized protein n=1 Tax=Sphaerisporangium album TaxID=509200 RepID=A0A367FMH7_9ACTN|nr:hypothetical protein [Sphaerisporangium album]RCG31109.1 hypothetical protein DQ384_10115 [Sphaerisporangium album]
MAGHDENPGGERSRETSGVAGVDARDEDAIREELRLVDEDLARLRETARELRERIGDRADAPTDMNEMGTLINMADQQDAFIATLEARREDLLSRLREATEHHAR